LNAASGQYLAHENLEIGYYFEYAAKETDLETIYQIDGSSGRPSNNAKSNIIRREFLFDVKLSLYLTDPHLIELLKKPVYPILLGRSNDLATVEKIKTVELIEQTQAAHIRGQVIPFGLQRNFLAGTIQALPRYFSNDFPRKNLGTSPFSVIRFDAPKMQTTLTAFQDTEQSKGRVDIFFHRFNLADYV
jgi:CRISPR-associated protein Cas5t